MLTDLTWLGVSSFLSFQIRSLIAAMRCPPIGTKAGSSVSRRRRMHTWLAPRSFAISSYAGSARFLVTNDRWKSARLHSGVMLQLLDAEEFR